MKGARPAKGFTVVETLIFLAVTGALFTSAMFLIASKQNQTDFDESIRDFQQQLQSLASNVTNGFNNTNNSFQCQSKSTPGQGIAVSAGNTAKGQNKDCIFVGEALQFGPQDKETSVFRVYTLVGQRQFNQSGTIREVTSLTEAKPMAVAQGNAPFAGVPNNVSNEELVGGSKFAKVTYVSGGVRQPTGVIAIVTTFPSITGTTQTLQNGTIATDIAVLGCTNIGQSQASAVEAINTQLAGSTAICPTPVIMNPASGVQFCLTGAVNQFAVITLGGTANAQATTHLDVYNKGSEPSGACT